MAIYAESDKEQLRLKRDFTYELTKRLSGSELGDMTNVMVVRNHQAESVDIKKINKYAKQTRAHLILWGDIKRRQNEEQTYFIQLDGMVRHMPIPIELSKTLSKDFLAVLPKKVSFYEKYELKGFEVTRDLVYFAIRYICGLAAFVSGDVFLAHRLHDKLEDDLGHHDIPSLQKIRNEKIPLLLSDEAFYIARHHYVVGEFEKMAKWLERSLMDNPRNYGAYLLKAIKSFEIDSDPAKAQRNIEKAKNLADGRPAEWLYSRAFLCLWEQDYDKALRSLSKIKNSSFDGEDQVAIEVLEYSGRMLERFPHKIQLNFYCGWVAYTKLGNYPKALNYYEKYLSSSSARPGQMISIAKDHLEKIRKFLNLA